MPYSSGANDVLKVLFDDLHFIYDTTGPEIASVVLQNTPTYYQDAIIDITTTDALGLVDSVVLYYRNVSSWHAVLAINIGGDVFRATIPFGEYGTTYEYYLEVEDIHNHMTLDNNSGLYYSYTVGDDVNPIISITAPANDTTVSGDLLIEVDCSDIGSDIDFVEFYDGPLTIIGTDSSGPYNFLWNTRLVSNGVHEIFAIAYDNDGNSESTSIIVNLDNDFDGPLLSNLHLNPAEPIVNTPVEVRVEASDASGLDYVSLFYRIDSGTWTEVAMVLNSGNYTGQIPGVAAPSLVEYYIHAEDTHYQVSELGSALDPYSYQFEQTPTEVSSLRFGAVGIIAVIFFLVKINKRRKVA